MKKDLTATQKEFIEFMKDEFIKLNSKESNEPFKAVNINALANDLNAISTAKEELNLHNKAMTKLYNESIVRFCADMNDDFKKGNFPIVAKVTELTDGYQIEVEYEKHREVGSSDIYSYRVEMRTSRKSEEIKHGLHSIGYKIVAFENEARYDSKERFASPQLFFANAEIQKALVRLIEVSVSLKTTGKFPSRR